MKRWVMGMVAAWLVAGASVAIFSQETRPTDGNLTAFSATGGGGGMITREELDKIPLNSVADPPAVEGSLVFPEIRTAVWLGQKEFAEGEAIPAWLILKSLAGAPERGLPADFDLGRPGEMVRVSGTARLQLARGKAGGEEIVADVKGEAAHGSVRRILLPPGDFSVNEGDVRNLAEGNLGPGDYTLRFWAQGQRSQASFRVTPGRAAAKMAAPASEPTTANSVVMQWIGSWDFGPGGRRRRGGQAAAAVPPAAPPGRLSLRNGYVALRTIDDFEKGLTLGIGAGPGGRYFSRIADLSEHDDVVRMAARFIQGTPDHIEITLTAMNVPAGSQPGAASAPAASTAPATVALPTYVQVYFLVENLGPPMRHDSDSDRANSPRNGKVAFVSPLVLDVEMPQNWWQRAGYSQKVRVTAIVSSDPVRFGVEQRLGETDDWDPAWSRIDPPREKRWIGAVKSGAMEVVLKGP